MEKNIETKTGGDNQININNINNIIQKLVNKIYSTINKIKIMEDLYISSMNEYHNIVKNLAT
jgi:hypothetical protein